MSAPLVDTHCHLCLPAFEQDLPQVLSRAAASGVGRILVPGIDLETSRHAVDLAEANANLFAAVGIHPHSAEEWSPDAYQALRSLARSERVVAIGETGLDYYRDRSPRPRQMEAFEGQLELADELSLPVIVHSREAAEDVLDRLASWSAGAAHRRRTGVLHAFSADEQAASSAVSAGFYIGVAGPVTYPSAPKLRQTVSGLPIDRLLPETDAPYLPPVPHRGQRNEPAHVALVSDALAAVRGVEPDRLRQACWDNAEALFRWDHGTDNRHVL